MRPNEDDAGDGRRVPGDGAARRSRATSAACRSSAPGERGPLTYEVVRNLLAERLPLIATARRVVVEVPFGLGRPSWATDRRFDLEFHLRHTAVPAGGGMARARRVHRPHPRPAARPLPAAVGAVGDRRPPRRARRAVRQDPHGRARRRHRRRGDDRAARRRPERHRPRPAALDPTTTAATIRCSGSSARSPTSGARRPGSPAGWPAGPTNTVGSSLAGIGDTISRDDPPHAGHGGRSPGSCRRPSTDEVVDDRASGRAPMLSWNGPITGRRRFATTTLPLDEIIEIKRRAGTTVNDVVVAVVAGAVRDWLDRHDELPTSPTVALVPLLVGGDRRGRRPRRRARSSPCRRTWPIPPSGCGARARR